MKNVRFIDCAVDKLIVQPSTHGWVQHELQMQHCTMLFQTKVTGNDRFGIPSR